MTITEAIQKSIEGGYKKDDKSFIFAFNADFNIRSSALLDPLFWSALGKSLGWDNAMEYTEGNYCQRHCPTDHRPIEYRVWLWHQHRLIDHLAEGGTIESYFAELK